MMKPRGKGIETAGCAAMLLRGLGEEQVEVVLQVRTLVDVSLKGTAEKTEVFLLQLRCVVLLNEEVLLVYDTVVRQDQDRLGPRRIYRLILRLYDGEGFRKLHTIADRDISILADDAVVLNQQNRELTFEGSCFHYISHDFLFLRLGINQSQESFAVDDVAGMVPCSLRLHFIEKRA